MFCERLRKVPDKIKGGIVNLRAPLTIPNGNHVRRKVILAVVCMLTIVVLGVIIGAFGSSKTIVYASSVQGVGVEIYWDQACTNRTLSLHWGLVGAGSNNTLTIYVKNEGNSAVSLWLGTSNWTPSASLGYMSLNWNYSGQVFSVDQVIPLKLTLTVSPTISGITGFSFDTIITASER
ncbi:MAG: hypothetical protein ABSA75_15120 [Candidatus Bathyarchaeia archaeon]|jgi:hypothetical protein